MKGILLPTPLEILDCEVKIHETTGHHSTHHEDQVHVRVLTVADVDRDEENQDVDR